jgi:NarL family two-component system response regulator YdfI
VIRVFIVAASPLARAGLQSLLATRDVEVVGSAPNFESLAGLWLDAEADIVLLDASGEQFEAVMDSLGASQLASETTIVLLSDHSELRWFAEALRSGVRAVLPSDISPDQLVEPLTPREIEILQMLASGLANKEIAARLSISEHTVKFHVASILGKLGAGSRTEAVTLGIRHGLVLL